MDSLQLVHCTSFGVRERVSDFTAPDFGEIQKSSNAAGASGSWRSDKR